MSGPAAAYAITCLLLCSMTEAVRASYGSRADGNPHDPTIQAMIDCRLWLSHVPGCPRATFAGAPRFTEDSPTPRLPSAPDREGIKRDTYYFLGLQLSVVGALYFMPESVSGWSDQQKNQHHAQKWWKNVSGPTWDEDDDYINYVLHPYWGAAYYVRARERGYGAQDAFLYSFLLSTLYEAGVEALFEPLSIQDFFITPIVGSWLGGYFVDWRRATKDRMARTGEHRLRDKVLLVATDPLGNAADFIDRRLGRDVAFQAAPFIAAGPAMPGQPLAPPAGARHQEVYGVTFTLRW